MKKALLLPIAAVTMLFSTASYGQECEMRSLADTIMSLSEGRIVINRPDGIENKIWSDTLEEKQEPKIGTSVVKKGGYRIQVYSDNHPRLAKSNTSRIASQISGEFPEMRAYIVYKAPYWRLKVGDFSKREDALEAMTKIKQQFPKLANEMIVVRDRINVIE